jgi:hypothetical protein
MVVLLSDFYYKSRRSAAHDGFAGVCWDIIIAASRPMRFQVVGGEGMGGGGADGRRG